MKKMVSHFQEVISNSEEAYRRSERRVTPPLASLSIKDIYSKRIVRSVSGIVTNQEGEPLLGVNIQVKDSDKGTSTDFDGKFSLEDIDENAVLVISYIGYQRQEVEILGRSDLSITLTSDAQLLDEVVVVGYGTMKKRDLTGAVSVVDGEEISRKNDVQLSTVLQGLISGVSITRNSSIPGSNTGTIRVRGITTIGNSNPLILVDGIAVENIDRINPNDVESISVLKDAAAASIYGSRAAAGVILITTKKPRENTVSLEYSGNIGAQTPTRLPEMVNVTRYLQMINEVAWNDGGNTPGGEFPVYGKNFIEDYMWNNKFDPDNYPNTDWQKELLKKRALFTTHNMSANYGNEVVRLRASLNYDYSDGLYINKSDEKISARINSDIEINRFITAKLNTYYFYNLNNGPTNNPFTTSYKYAKTAIPYWSDGFVAPGRSGTNMWARLNHGGFIHNQRDQFYGRFGLVIRPVSNLTLTGYFAPSIYKTKEKNFVKQVPYYNIDDRTKFAGLVNGNLTNKLTESRPETRTLTKQLYANYETSFGSKHDIALMVGYEDHYRKAETFSASSDHMVLEEFPYLNRGNLDFLQNTGNANETSYQSMFGRINYELDDKYLIQANIRRDGSSRFAKKYRWGTLPSVSAGWILSREALFRDINLSVIYCMRIRVYL